ncbi:unnamed protein product [Ectocarpus sp. CCAP 1310/34]|nr:unnamed protein product [Ectocarpus sp. CCAP 1310/34]
MERFLPSAGGSSAAGLRPCGEPTCQQKSQLVSAIHQCPCGRSMHAFCGRGIGEEGYGQQRECSDCQKSKGGDQAGSSSSPMEVVKKMSLPESAKDLDARSMPRVLSDNLFVESTSGLTEQEVRSAVSTWLSVEDDEEVLREEVELEMEEVTENMSRVHVEDDVSSEEEDQDGRQESCMTSTISEAEVRSRLEDVRSYLYANGRDGEYSETVYLLSKTVHSFTHETQVKRRTKEGGEVQATLRDVWAT